MFKGVRKVCLRFSMDKRKKIKRNCVSRDVAGTADK